MTRWIGVDLDHTLAFYDEWRGVEHIGEPIPKMADRVRNWLTEGKKIKIFTARVSSTYSNRAEAIYYIQNWTEKHFGIRLECTAEKDGDMEELWDDRAVGVERNTGKVQCQCFKQQEK